MRRGAYDSGMPAPLPLSGVVVACNEADRIERCVASLRAVCAEVVTRPQLRIDINRERAAALGVSVQDIGRTLETMMGSRRVGTYVEGGEEYDVILQAQARDRATPGDLANLYVRSSAGQLIPLASLVTLRELAEPGSLNRFNRLRAITVSASLAPGTTLGEGLAFLEKTARDELPAHAQIDYKGQSLEYRESSSQLAFTFALALIIVFLVLAAQFESFVDPFVIMLSVPLSMIGALLALKFTGGSLNVYSQIGLITLVGLITKHGILIVEFTNQLREHGMAMKEALIQASSQRLRPILMTTGAMVLGAVPLALAKGAGAESRMQIGWVIVGGMSLGTLLTIFVVPTMYSLFARQAVPGPNKAVANEYPPQTDAADINA